MGRVAASLGANIAEGYGRRGERQMRGFLEIGRGSANGPEYHLLRARELQLPENAEFRDLGGQECLSSAGRRQQLPG
jgi:four helix bundle protein